MNKEYRRNHYIPECYLKGFSENEKIVWIYNKKISKSYPKSVDDIFYEKDFYLIDESLIPEEGRDMINYKSIEYDFFAEQIESQYADFLGHVRSVTDDLKKQDLSCISLIPECWVEQISLQLLIQYIRTPEARRQTLELLTTSRFCFDILADSPWLSEKEKEYYKLESQKSYGDVIDHFMVLFNKEKEAEVLYDKNCLQIYDKNKSQKKFTAVLNHTEKNPQIAQALWVEEKECFVAEFEIEDNQTDFEIYIIP